MMREVSGAFCGARKLDEALEDLRAEGIAGDRVRLASMSGFADFHASQTQSNNAQTQWIAAEYAGHGEHLGVVDTHDYPFGLDMTGDDILPSFGADGGDADEACAITRVIVSIRDEAEMRAVCDIFSRLGTDDIDVESVAA
ncbi:MULTISPECIES: hypothetical protein [Caballeronia]|uniref:hypothetical protein n=1 Tax=Caballeronia TaxID=1827195 RepID=UPI000238899E|nr:MULTISPECIES: hypothetical protein [unclassified Caballeronia]AET93926.1 hypothetical protein BYI23_D004160 [Burkholderia sp. YI23]AQH04173.1 hypothetical protein A9R05_35090 [Burkholderia sp. KK1]BAO91743.1 uncharacterized protein BRPE67_DCDS05880 [Burkholderia sp. RPE67]BBQ02220.1 hypothetical protein BSFA1_73480 [Burkholderia sp. SFA1]MCE4547115.1 hypothetical protein [Caballeronia sp. PC1]